MAQLKDVLYTAEATATGGRKGHARTSDGRLDLQLSRPKEFKGEGGPGTNPEQLFAVGYAACFQSAMESVARAKEIDVTGNEVTSHVSIGPVEGGGYGIAAELIVSLPSLDQEAAEQLVEQAHKRCPYSRATRGNIEVDLTVKSG
jgi:osmotically inducible protein OsmC